MSFVPIAFIILLMGVSKSAAQQQRSWLVDVTSKQAAMLQAVSITGGVANSPSGPQAQAVMRQMWTDWKQVFGRRQLAMPLPLHQPTHYAREPTHAHPGLRSPHVMNDEGTSQPLE
ncbi:hypothetical protein HaLaN_23275, partial [Haematococcus lacustris]